MKTFGFPHPGPLLAGTYLLGSPRWSRGADLLQARISCLCGDSLTPTVLGLEVGGVLSDVTISIQPVRAGELIQNAIFQIGYSLPVNTEIRWLVLSAPDEAVESITRFGLTLVAGKIGAIVPTPAASALYVMWQSGAERLRLFEYDPDTHTFTESSAGIASGRASLVNVTEFQASIQSVTAMAVDASGVCAVNLFYCNGGSMALEAGPRLEFYYGARRLASLTKTGTLYVPDINELPTVDGGSDRFEFYGGGILAAVLGANVNLLGKELAEPV